MFITKKKLAEMIHEAKMETAKEWDSKLANRDREIWEEKRYYDLMDNVERRFGEVQKRIHAIELHTGMVEECCICNCKEAVRPSY